MTSFATIQTNFHRLEIAAEQLRAASPARPMTSTRCSKRALQQTRHSRAAEGVRR